MRKLSLFQSLNIQAGLASVEFAAVLPIMLVLMLSTAELGRALHNYNTLSKTVRNGARYASENILNGVGNATLSQSLAIEVKNIVVSGTTISGYAPLLDGLSGDNVTVEILQAGSNGEPHVRVVAHWRFIPIVGSIPTLENENRLIKGFDLQSAVTMRAL